MSPPSEPKSELATVLKIKVAPWTRKNGKPILRIWPQTARSSLRSARLIWSWDFLPPMNQKIPMAQIPMESP